MDYMVYVAIVYYLITEIGGRIVEYNSGLKKVAGSWQLSRNSNWTLSNDFKIQIIYYWGSGGHGGNGGHGVHGNQRTLWQIYINARALSGRHRIIPSGQVTGDWNPDYDIISRNLNLEQPIRREVFKNLNKVYWSRHRSPSFLCVHIIPWLNSNSREGRIPRNIKFKFIATIKLSKQHNSAIAVMVNIKIRHH